VREFYLRSVRNWEIPARAHVYGFSVDSFDYRGILFALTLPGACACVFCLIRL